MPEYFQSFVIRQITQHLQASRGQEIYVEEITEVASWSGRFPDLPPGCWEHLSRCALCQQDLAQHYRLGEVLKRCYGHSVTAPAGLRERIIAQITVLEENQVRKLAPPRQSPDSKNALET